MTLNVHMSQRHKLRALDVLIREYQYPLTPHVQEAGPLIPCLCSNNCLPFTFRQFSVRLSYMNCPDLVQCVPTTLANIQMVHPLYHTIQALA